MLGHSTFEGLRLELLYYFFMIHRGENPVGKRCGPLSQKDETVIQLIYRSNKLLENNVATRQCQQEFNSHWKNAREENLLFFGSSFFLRASSSFGTSSFWTHHHFWDYLHFKGCFHVCGHSECITACPISKCESPFETRMVIWETPAGHFWFWKQFSVAGGEWVPTLALSWYLNSWIS